MTMETPGRHRSGLRAPAIQRLLGHQRGQFIELRRHLQGTSAQTALATTKRSPYTGLVNVPEKLLKMAI